MPFRSERQRRFLWSQHPDIARRWTAEHGSTPVPAYPRSRLPAYKRQRARVRKTV